MKSTLRKTSIAALILGMAVALLWLAVSSKQAPSGSARSADAAKYASSLRPSSFSLSVHTGVVTTSASRVFPLQPAPALELAMADFTGDTDPDLATVELDRVDSANAHYWIEIRLTEGRGQVLALTAPFGGLLIDPRDVTGDGNLDLVVLAAKTRALVAVFLNDGNGHFDRANAASFSRLPGGEPCDSSFTRRAIYLPATLGCPEWHQIGHPKGHLRPLVETNDSLLSPSYNAGSQKSLAFSSNRAPPTSA